MKTAGIICEYNPFHLGHLYHIEETKKMLGGDACIVCVMSGNFVQRGDFAVFNKHARAKMAVLCGADIVIELPVPYALGAAREFAKAGVYLLDLLGVCDYLSFGSESGNIDELRSAAHGIATEAAEENIRLALASGLSYAAAQQLAADAVKGINADIFKSPNNTLAVEYIKALGNRRTRIIPVTVKRAGGEHDGEAGYSAGAVRKSLASGTLPMAQMPGAAVAVCMEEMVSERGPVLTRDLEQAMLSRLRAIPDYSVFPAATDGLDRRFIRCAPEAPSVISLLESVKTKRYAMSRIRRVMMCAVLGITSDYVKSPPPYIRVLAMNKRGMMVLKRAGGRAGLPIITKPAVVRRLGKEAVRMFNLESRTTDFYALAYTKPEDRRGGGEWRTSPVVVTA